MGTDRESTLNYEENVRLQQKRLEQLERYDRDLSQAYSRFLELGNQKKALLDQIIELTQPNESLRCMRILIIFYINHCNGL